MYAITATSFRAITTPADAVQGETVVEIVPQSLLDSLQQSEASRQSVKTSLQAEADSALVELRAFRDLDSPTNAQTLAAVKLLCRVCIGLIKLSLNKLSETN